MPERPVLGVDWHKSGWIGVVLGRGAPQTLVGPDLAELVARVEDAACVGVDMPIGLPETTRESDVLARAFVGPRRSSVFMTPPRAVLDAGSYPAANALAREIVGKGLAQQAWALRRNILHVEAVAVTDPRVIEVHPEVSFCAMRDGEHLAFAKTTWNGQAIRRAALAAHGIVLPDELDGAAGHVPVADVLDAAAVAWTARRHARGGSRSLPDGWERGRPGAIWY